MPNDVPGKAVDAAAVLFVILVSSFVIAW